MYLLLVEYSRLEDKQLIPRPGPPYFTSRVFPFLGVTGALSLIPVLELLALLPWKI